VDIEERLREVEQEIISRRPEHSVDLALDRMADLVELLGQPQRACPVIHITGTNGKTSTARMIDALLRSRGLRTGRFTSPHLVSIRERICVDGVPVSAERFVEAYEEIIPYVGLVDDRHPVSMSFFEVLTGMAFAIFADAPVDVAILEVGVGGRLDCTNVADGAVAVITPVAIDHTRLLGSTVEEIAGEKAGIIKPGAVAVLAQQSLPAAEVLLRHASEVGATVAREGVEFGVLSDEQAVGGQLLSLRGLRGTYSDVFLPLYGRYQAGNAACALAAVEAFAGVAGAADEEGQALDADLVREAFAKVSSPGRLEIIRRSPTIIIDASHNPAGLTATVAAIQETFTFAHLSGVFAASGDKDVAGMLAELEPLLDEIVVTRNSSERSMEVGEVAELAAEIFGEDRVASAARLDDAIEAAVALADEAEADGVPGSGGVLITGSVITAGDARRLLGPNGGELPPEASASQPSRHSFTAAELS
jgi:dihydrofolate synthase/folylpolyglutamate synthase